MKTILVTGGAGFIGSAVIRHLINDTDSQVINVDKLTYAGNLESLISISDNSRYHFEQVDICDAKEIQRVLNHYQPDIIMHLAAESHVDRSIDGPGDFIQTNIVGTYNLLEQARTYWVGLTAEKKAGFRFHHISTDEVYGDLPHPDEYQAVGLKSDLQTNKVDLSETNVGWTSVQQEEVPTRNTELSKSNVGWTSVQQEEVPTRNADLSKSNVGWTSVQQEEVSTRNADLSKSNVGWTSVQQPPLPLFTETTSYAPSSPYSASKASSDHLVRAWNRTYNLPTIVTNCSNNYGPFHFPEKLIPLVILNALQGKPLPVYGKGHQIRDWLFVEDHARALVLVATTGQVAETYNIGGHNEKQNIEVVNTICELLEELAPNKPAGVNQYHDLITFVTDRAGHDVRYAIDASKIAKELNWTPLETFESGIRKTVQWYLDNQDWCHHVQDGSYQQS